MTDEEIKIAGYAYMMGYRKGKQDIATSVKNKIETVYKQGIE